MIDTINFYMLNISRLAPDFFNWMCTYQPDKPKKCSY